MKKSDIYQFYFLGIGRHLSAMVGSGSIAYDRDKHRYVVPEGMAFSAAERDLKVLFEAVPAVLSGRGKDVDFSPIIEAEEAFWNRAKGVFGILD